MTDLFDWRDQYPVAPGHRRTDTSKAAAEAMKPGAATLRHACLATLRRHASGLTADECAAVMGETVLAVRPRCTELRALGSIADSGKRRPNASGRMAIMWKAA